MCCSDYFKNCSTGIYILSLKDSEKSFKTAHAPWPLMIWKCFQRVFLQVSPWSLPPFQNHPRSCKWTWRWAHLLFFTSSQAYIQITERCCCLSTKPKAIECSSHPRLMHLTWMAFQRSWAVMAELSDSGHVCTPLTLCCVYYRYYSVQKNESSHVEN